MEPTEKTPFMQKSI